MARVRCPYVDDECSEGDLEGSGTFTSPDDSQDSDYDCASVSEHSDSGSADVGQNQQDPIELDREPRRRQLGSRAVEPSVSRMERSVEASNRAAGAPPAATAGFRMAAQSFLLTWPQSAELSPSQCLDYLSSLDKHEWSACVTEHHADGNVHLHAVVHFRDRKDIRNARYFDVLGHHANIKPVKGGKLNMTRALKYIAKETVPEVRGVSSFTELLLQYQKSKGAIQEIAEAVKAGKGMTDLLKEDHLLGSLMLHGPKVASFASQLEVAKEDARRKEYDIQDLKAMRCATPAAQKTWELITSWLEHMIRKPLPFRPLQMWIRGPPGIGKSLLTSWLKDRLKVYMYPREPYHDLWRPDTEIIIDDDHAPTQRVQDLLKWSAGDTMSVPMKFGTKMKSGAYPFLILSNDMPADYYTRVSLHTLDALAGSTQSRFFLVDWKHSEGFPFPVDENVKRWEPPV